MSQLPPQDPTPSHSSLPSKPDAQPTQPGLAAPGSPEEVPQRSYAHVNNVFTYLIHLSLDNSSNGGYVFLIHEQKFADEQLKDMCDEVTKVITEVRLPRAREQATATSRTSMFRDAEHKKRVLETREMLANRPEEVNENQFADDVKFFEAAMCDKFNFRVLRYTVADITVEPLIVKPRG